MRAINFSETTGFDISSESGQFHAWNFHGQTKKSSLDLAPLSLDPQSFLLELRTPGSTLGVHFHDVDQFQVVVAGDGKIGGREFNPVTCHYADGYAPYGPIVAHDKGLSYFTLRLHGAGTFGMPENKHLMLRGNSRPRNFARAFEVAVPMVKGQVDRQQIWGPAPEDGLAIVGLRLGPDTSAQGEAASTSGQYMLVCSGAIIHEGKEYRAKALFFLDTDEPAPEFVAGPNGAAVLIMQFPRHSNRPGADLERLAARNADHRISFE
jgi:hypothetical protein